MDEMRATLPTPGGELRHAALHFSNGVGELGPASLVRGRLQLALELGARQPQRLAGTLRLERFRARRHAAALLSPFPFKFFESFLDPRLRVDQALSRVT